MIIIIEMFRQVLRPKIRRFPSGPQVLTAINAGPQNNGPILYGILFFPLSISRQQQLNEKENERKIAAEMSGELPGDKP